MSNDLRFSANGLTYPEICDLMDSLRAANIECNISQGCLAIYPSEDQVPTMKSICEFKNAYLMPGSSAEAEDAVLRGDDKEAIDRYIDRTNAAHNLLYLPKS